MSIISWGKPKVEVAAHVGGAKPQKSFTLVKANAIADTTIEIAKNSGIVVGDVIGLSISNPAAKGGVTDDGDELAQLDAEVTSELDEAGFFGGSGDDSRGES